MKLIKFDLSIDGVKVKTVAELREHFTPEILDRFRSGLLEKWLLSRKLQDELEAVKALEGAKDPALLKGLCEVFGIEADDTVIAAVLNNPTPTCNLNISDAVKQSEEGNKVVNLADVLPIKPGEMKLFTNRLLAIDSFSFEDTELIFKSKNGVLIFTSCEISHPINGRYLDLGDGSVSDVFTYLQWMRCLLGQTWTGDDCDGEAGEYTWDQAHSAVKKFNEQGGYAGHRDWRLPSSGELMTLVYRSSCEPKAWPKAWLDPIAFPNAPCWRVWSSSPTGDPDSALVVYFYCDQVEAARKSSGHHVRLVRGGQ